MLFTTMLMVGATASGQTPVPLFVEGEAIPGFGTTVSLGAHCVSARGEWVGIAATTSSPALAFSGLVTLKNGVRGRYRDEVLSNPAGGVVSSLRSNALNGSGDMVSSVLLRVGSTSQYSSLWFNDVIVLEELDAPSIPGITPGSHVLGIYDVHWSGVGDDYLVFMDLRETSFPNVIFQVFARMTIDANGVSDITPLLKHGDVIPGVGALAGNSIALLASDTRDIDRAGTLIASVAVGTKRLIVRGNTALAVSGQPSAIPGETWSLFRWGVATHETGGYAFIGSTFSNRVIVKNGLKFVQTGDSPPSITPFQIESLGDSIDIDQHGRVTWVGYWDDPDPNRGAGLFLDDQLIVETGVTVINGATLISIENQGRGKSSPDGRYWLFVGKLSSGEKALFRV